MNRTGAFPSFFRRIAAPLLAAAFGCAAFANGAFAADPSGRSSRFPLTLRDAEARSLDRSFRVAAAKADLEAVRSQAKAAATTLHPRLTLEGSYRYVSDVPTLDVGAMSVRFGDHSSYSVGPLLSYSLMDGGSSRSIWRSLEKLAEAREQDRQQSESQTRLAVRHAYFRVQLGVEELKLVSESMKLAQSQERDIRNRFQAGASSRIDTLSARREVLALETRFQQSQAELASSLRDLATLIRIETELDLTDPGAVFELDSLEMSLRALALVGRASFNSAHPQVISFARLSESATLASQSYQGELSPRIQIYGKSTLEYPNGPKLEKVWQNTAGVSLTLPLFESGRARSLSSQKAREAIAAELRSEQVRIDLKRDHEKAHLQLRSLESQRGLSAQAVREAAEIAELIYGSYKAGRASFLEVQSANNRALESRVLLARIDAQMLAQTAILAALSDGNE